MRTGWAWPECGGGSGEEAGWDRPVGRMGVVMVKEAGRSLGGAGLCREIRGVVGRSWWEERVQCRRVWVWASWRGRANCNPITPCVCTVGFRGWEVEHGGNGWAVEKNVTLIPGAPSQTCFVTSFE